MLMIVSSYKDFHSIENTEGTLQYSNHFEDYQLNTNALVQCKYSFALVDLGFHINKCFPLLNTPNTDRRDLFVLNAGV